ncbi:lysylphosphatidylglycerol synthase domain-containing protein [Streptomyces sp. NPDC008240]|uniref:lysylphosphatidylglycerol synthase domain-containing protein n=1 Tax=Streptomyces sp. NPDC008240 TaxID=3364822 RepID=UPI0036F0A6C5
MSHGGIRRLHRPVLRWVTVGTIVVCLCWTVQRQDWSAARPVLTLRALPYLTASGALNVLALVCAMLSWRSIMAEVGHPLPRLQAARIYFFGMTAKYLPGQFWVAITQARLAKRAGVPGRASIAVFLLNVPVILLTGLLVGALAGPGVLGGWSWLLLAPAFLLGLVLIRPELVGRTAAVVARLTRKEPPAVTTGPKTRAAVGWLLACRLVSGLHLWLLVMALGAPAMRSLSLSIGAFSLAAVSGMLVVFLPDGAVVRELLMAGVLVQVLPVTAAAAAAIASRAVCLGSELLLTAVILGNAAVVRNRQAPAKQGA